MFTYQITKGHSHITFKMLTKWLGTIEDLYVDENHRREGIATELIKDIEVVAIRHEVRKLSLLCKNDNVPALVLYLQNGYTIEATLKQHYSADHDHYVLSKFIGEVQDVRSTV